MSWDNKVVWSEGLFLRPQHFQQHDRYIEKLVSGRAAALVPHPWGITELAINRELLTIGKFGLSTCRGVLSDGTPFAIPEDAEHPKPIELPEGTRNCIVYLALPVRQPGAIEVDAGAGRDGAAQERAARHRAVEFEVSDSTGDGSEALLQVGKLSLRFALESEERSGFLCLGLARIVEMRADRNVLLDERYIPPALLCSATPPLMGFLTELQGMLHHRGEALAGRVSEAGSHGVAEIADFLLLQAVNRAEPLIAHFAAAGVVHPERLYATCVALAGELATFTSRGKRPPSFPAYRHDDLEKTFAPVIAQLHQSLSAVLEQTAVPIALQERKYGIRVGPITDRGLVANANLVLAVRADMPAEHLRRHFPSHVKIGPVESIRELVNVALPGIPVRPLPVAPRQLPYHAGAVYFELERGGEHWKQLTQSSGGIALHLSGDFPRVEMELWAIRG